ncbi:MAG: GGDEF domain-containing protein [Bacillota bacterium]
MRNEFQRSVTITEQNVENTLNRFIEGAESLSSRTMIKNKLGQYKGGEISLIELKEYTKEKYADGAKVLENVVGAYRISDNEVITSWGEKDFHKIRGMIDFDNQNTEIIISKEKTLLIVNSPILKEKTKLGNDIVVFNLEKLLNEINSHQVKYNIIYDQNMNKEKLIVEDNIKDFRQLLNTNYWLKAKMPKVELYNSLNDLSMKIIGGFILLLLIIIISFYKTLNYTSAKVIDNLKEKVVTDEMLDVYNRTKLMEELEKEIKRAFRYKNDLSVIMFDIDYFKEINDKYGHLTGDDILIKIINTVKNEIREIDFLARYGGDEFIIINPETKLEESVKLAERLKTKIANTTFEEVEKVTCSFGVTELKKDDNIDILLKRVDDALYEAKENGRNKVIKE